MSAPTTEQLKARSKHLGKLLQEKYDIKVSHGHCLDVVAQLFGAKDWNTISASAPSPGVPDAELPGRQNMIAALLDGFRLQVERPYKIDRYHVGGSNASHHVDQGSNIFVEFDVRIDVQQRAIALVLPLSSGEVASDSVVTKTKYEYQNFFDQKLYLRNRTSTDVNPIHRDLQERAERDLEDEMKAFYPDGSS